MSPTPFAYEHRGAPWYREPWPWILMAGPAIVIIAGVVTGWLAVRSYDGLIVDDYYKRGLAVNQVLARGAEAARLGIDGTMRLRADSGGVIELTLNSASGPLPPTVHVALTHPTRAGFDQRVRAVYNAAEGVYAGSIEALAPGRWHAVAEDDRGTWRVRGTLSVPAMGEVELRPAH